MGIESYSTILLPKEILQSGEKPLQGCASRLHAEVIGSLKRILDLNTHELSTHELVVENALILRSHVSGPWLRYITLEGSFAAFDHSLEMTCNVAQKIHRIIDVDVFYPPATLIAVTKRGHLKQMIALYHQARHNLFLARFGQINELHIPGRPFHDTYNWGRRKTDANLFLRRRSFP